MTRYSKFALLAAAVLLVGCGSDKKNPAAPEIAGPSELSATTTHSSVSLRWKDNSQGTAGFRVERAPTGRDVWTRLAELQAARVTFTDTDTILTEGSAWSYRVFAFSGGTTSAPAGPVIAVTILRAPTGLVVVRRSEISIGLTWTDVTVAETGYQVERKTDTLSFARVAELPAGSFAHVDSGLTPSRTYSYRVRAVKDTIASAYSSVRSATTTIQAPARPSGLTVTSSAVAPSSAALSWMDNALDELGFVVEKSRSANSGWEFADSLRAGVTRDTLRNLPSETVFHFRVYAFNTAGNSVPSDVASVEIVGPPAAPSALGAMVLSHSSIRLTWADNSQRETGYRVERHPAGGSTWTTVAELEANVLTYTDTALAEGSGFSYQVIAFNGAISSPPAGPVTAVTVLRAPTGLRADRRSESSIGLTWTDVAGTETGYQVERKVGAAAFARIAALPAGAVALVDVNLIANTTYIYRVRAVKDTVASSYSSEDDATTTVQPPVAPSGLAVTSSAEAPNSAVLTWQDNSSDEVGFVVEKSVALNSGWEFADSLRAGATRDTLRDLPSEVIFYFRVYAFNAHGSSSPSNVISVEIVGPPAAPSGLRATVQSHSSIRLNWTDNSRRETGYQVERAPAGGSNWTRVAELPASSTVFTDTDLSEGSGFSYRVLAVSGAVRSAPVGPVTAVTVLRAPTGLTAVRRSDTSIGLAWTDVSGAETGYQMERKTGAAAFAQVAILPAGAVTLVDLDLTPNTTYVYRVRAVKDTLASAYSNEAQARTTAQPPFAPSGLQAASSAAVPNSAVLSWIDNASDEVGFVVLRSVSGSGWQATDSLRAGETRDTIRNLPSEVVFFFRVYAYNSHGNSDSSDVASVEIVGPPAAPSALVAVGVSPSSIGLTWTDNSRIETGYRVERAPAGSGNFTLRAELPPNTIAFTDDGLTEGSGFSYRVFAILGAVSSDPAGPVNAITLPQAPTGLRAVRRSEISIGLAWTDASAVETGYEVERRIGATFVRIASLPAGAVAYVDGSLNPGVTYRYRVRAVKDMVSSGYSNEANAITTVYTPGAPTELAAAAGARPPNSVSLTWRDNSDNEAGFVIEKSLAAEAGWEVADTKSAGIVRAQLSGLPAETVFYFRVYAFNDSGRSAYSNVASVEVIGPPAAPSELTAIAPTWQAALLRWRDNSGNELGFRVERSSPPGVSWTGVASPDSNSTDYADSSVAQNTLYAYRVRAYNAVGNSDSSNVVEVQIPNGPPAGPRNLTATALDVDRIILAWQDRANNETDYFVERRLEGAEDFDPIAVLRENARVYTDSSLTPDTGYEYRVYCSNDSGSSPYSNVALARTQSLVVFSDGFEEHTADQPPGRPWEHEDVGTSTATVSEIEAHEGTQCLQFVDPNATDGNYSRVWIQHRGIPRGIFDCWLMLAPNGYFGTWAMGGAQLYFAFQVQFNNDGRILCRNGRGSTGVFDWADGNWTPNRWMHLVVTFDMDSDRYDVDLDDRRIVAGFNMQNTPEIDLQRIQFLTFGNAAISWARVDEASLTLIRRAPEGALPGRRRSPSSGPVASYQGGGSATIVRSR